MLGIHKPVIQYLFVQATMHTLAIVQEEREFVAGDSDSCISEKIINCLCPYDVVEF